MRLTIALLIAVLVGAAALWMGGHRDAAGLFSILGTPAALGIVLAYIVAVDSKTRWPGKTALVRLGKVVFFER